jgi:tRNA nucleotidyltransferase (CCA-adding enzyme)
MEVYLVGGAVRDRLLELPVDERDWVVTGATPDDLLALGYRQVGKDFPVFIHPLTGDEYALARTERKIGPGYRGFEFHASPDVTLEQDLLRRDLTINAMAETKDGALIDPCHGERDLEQGLLRHIGPAFVEDPVRILRVARFAARFAKWGFRVAHGTNALMREMVDNGEVDHLVAERVWAELSKALATDSPHRFFQVLRGCGALSRLFPEIDREYPAGNETHSNKQCVKPLEALEYCATRNTDPRIRFATLLHALGQGLPLERRIEQIRALCKRLRVPKEYSQLASCAVEQEQNAAGNKPDQILEFMEAAGAFRHTERWHRLLNVYEIAALIDHNKAEALEDARIHCAEVNAAQIDKPDLSGPALGAAIRARRVEIIRDSFTGRD